MDVPHGLSYTFDSTGNRTGGDYVVSSKNRTDESTGYEYEYDRNGNRIKRLKTADNSYELYEFDHRNRLTDVKFYNSSNVLQKTIVYAYDAFNRMVRRTFDSDGPGGTAATDQFFAGFDGMHATLEFDGANRTDLTHRYLWGLGADELLADEQVTSTTSDGDILWALGDQVGTIRDIGEWNASTTEFEIANHREYDSFGNLISETDTSVDVDFGFNGKWTDSETEYTHHLNRWLDPVIGKWISEDPIGFAGGDANITRFVANQVLSQMDTDGLRGHSGGGGGKTIVTTGGASSDTNKHKKGDLDGNGPNGTHNGDGTITVTTQNKDGAEGGVVVTGTVVGHGGHLDFPDKTIVFVSNAVTRNGDIRVILNHYEEDSLRIREEVRSREHLIELLETYVDGSLPAIALIGHGAFKGGIQFSGEDLDGENVVTSGVAEILNRKLSPEGYICILGCSQFEEGSAPGIQEIANATKRQVYSNEDKLYFYDQDGETGWHGDGHWIRVDPITENDSK